MRGDAAGRVSLREVERLVGAIDEFEQRISAQRRALFTELDELTEELVNRYRDVANAAGTTADESEGAPR